MRISDAFKDPGSHINGAILFADMANSTQFKEKHAEPNWLLTLATFMDLIYDAVTEGGSGKIVKFTGDGVMVAFDANNVTDAIKTAIILQQNLDSLRKCRGIDAECLCTIGIAYGKYFKAETPNGLTDYLGSVADRAARLCAAAQSNAIIIDAAASSNVMWGQVSSTVGSAIHREDYKGNRQETRLKGFKDPIIYYEVLWAQDRFGLKQQPAAGGTQPFAPPPFTSRPAPVPPSPTTAPVTPPPPVERATWKIGTVSKWEPNSPFGFLVDKESRFYFCNTDMTVGRKPLQPGTSVVFMERPPMKQGAANSSTACAMAIDEIITAELRAYFPDKSFGFAEVKDGSGNAEQLFAYFGRPAPALATNKVYNFKIGTNNRGACGNFISAPPQAEALFPAPGPVAQ